MTGLEKDTLSALKGIREQLQAIAEQMVKDHYIQEKQVSALVRALNASRVRPSP